MENLNFSLEDYKKEVVDKNLLAPVRDLLNQQVESDMAKLNANIRLKEAFLSYCNNNKDMMKSIIECTRLNDIRDILPEEIANNEFIKKGSVEYIFGVPTKDIFVALNERIVTSTKSDFLNVDNNSNSLNIDKETNNVLDINKDAASLNVDNKAFSFDIFEKGGIRNIKDYMNSKGEIAKHNLITLYKNIDLTKLSNDEIKSLNSFMREHDFSTEKKTHIVSKGENLTFISQRYGVGLNDLIKENRNIRNPNIIHIGDKFTIPLNEAEKKMIEIEEKMKENIDNSNKIDDPKKEVETKEKEQHIKVSASDIDIEKFTMHF